jgi:hypothetical protein
MAGQAMTRLARGQIPQAGLAGLLIDEIPVGDRS